MFDIAFHFVLIYAYLLLAGAGVFLLLAPSWLQRGYVIPFVVPTLGFAHLTTLSMYLIRFRCNLGSLLAVSLAVALLLLAVGLLTQRTNLARIGRDMRNDLLSKGRWVTMLVAAALILFVVLSPALRHGSATVPFRVGHDQIQNVLVAQFFLEGGTLDSAKRTDSLRLDTVIVKEAVEGMRWGVSAVIAAYCRLTDAAHPYRIAFPSLTLNLVLLGGVTFFLLHYPLGISIAFSFVGAIATVLNCNLLNLLYEGFWAQAFTAPVFLLALILLLQLRADAGPLRGKDRFRSALLLAFLLLSLATTFSESIQIFFVFYVIVLFVDLVVFGKLPKSIPIFLIALGSMLFCLIPIIPMLGNHYLKILTYYLKVGGFWQPHWALPSEIIGLSDIYRNFLGSGPDFAPKLISRTPVGLLFNLSLSVVVVALFVTNIFCKKDTDRPFWLAAPVFVLLLFFVSFFGGQSNYSYMKSYTIFMPLLFGFFYDAFFHQGKPRPALPTGLFVTSRYALIGAVLLVGLFHVYEYRQTSSVVTEDMFQVYEFARKSDLRDVVFLPREKPILDRFPDQRYAQWLMERMILPLFPVCMIDEWRLTQQDFGPYISRKVYLFIKKTDLACWPCSMHKNSDRIVWENGTFLVLDTGKTLGQGTVPGRPGTVDLKTFWDIL